MKIKILSESEEMYIESYQRKTVSDILLENSIFVRNECHGNGTCGKCKIRVLKGNLPITEADRRSLTENELKQGIRLACKADLSLDSEENEKIKTTKESFTKKVCRTEQEELWIEIIEQSEEDIVAEGIRKEEKSGIYKKENIWNLSEQKKLEIEQKNYEIKSENACFIAIDIGTTTIAMALVSEETGEILDTYSSLNHQRKYGADVISRIMASNDGNTEELKKLIEEDLWLGIKNLLQAEKKNESSEKVNDAEKKITNEKYLKEKNINLSKIILAGNTTMIHLLMGYSCNSLGKYPFFSEHLGTIQCALKECIGNFQDYESKMNKISEEEEKKRFCKYENVPVIIFPGISAFVGGDIVADILACEEFETEGLCLLLDLGTNGEIVLGNKKKLLTTSTAAGPAFEGGNITYGTASIPGSICQVKIQNRRAVVRTIKNEMPPVGICGTGLISAVAQLKITKLISEDGELKKPFDKKGFPLWTFENGEAIVLSQKDIHEFQMAKAAIRAGIEILMEEYGCVLADIKKVYIAGGFGKAFNIEDMIITGILPEEWKDRIKVIGNGVLQGILKLAVQDGLIKYMEEICQRAEHLSLAQKERFQIKYIEYMKL